MAADGEVESRIRTITLGVRGIGDNEVLRRDAEMMRGPAIVNPAEAVVRHRPDGRLTQTAAIAIETLTRQQTPHLPLVVGVQP